MKDIYLGNVYGVWTRPMSYWAKFNAVSKEEIATLNIIKQQVRGFLDSHIPQVIKLIDEMMELTEK